jgi:prepilin-type N-terminal cleavage/methylation domain-containing protein
MRGRRSGPRRHVGRGPARGRGDAGLTLIELLVSMTILTVVLALSGPLLTGMLRTGDLLTSQASSLDELHLGVESVSNEARSAECVKLLAPVPAGDGDTTSSSVQMLVAHSGTEATVVYQVAGGRLTRSQDGAPPAEVAHDLVGDPSVFTLHAGTETSLVMDLQGAVANGHPVSLHATVTARAAWKSC